MLRDSLSPGKKTNNGAGPRKKGEEKEANSDSLEKASPTDIHADEKVIVNEQRDDKIVNTPSQTAANTSEGSSYDDEIIDRN